MQKHQEDRKRAPVLIIDDEPAHLKTIADILAAEQLQPVCCRTAKEALEACKQQRVNVGILDLRLPDMDGLQLLKRLKQKNPDIKVIIHTGYASLESAVAAINEEAYAYVRKIDDIEELLAQVHRAFHAHLTLHSAKLEQEVQKRTAELSRANQELKKEISRRKQAVEALRMTQFAVDNAADFIYRIDANARIRYANDAACFELGFSRDELLSLSIPDIDPNYSFERWLDSWRELQQHNAISSESTHRRKDGSTFPVEISISYHQINGVEYSYAFVRNITERKSLEQQLLQAQKMEAIGTLAGGVAHDFNNLLTVILGNTEFGLQDSNPKHPVYSELIRIEKAALQARDLTNQLLSFSRRQVFKPKIVKLNETIKDLLKMLKRIIGEDIELKVELALKLPLLWADPAQIQQVLMNLAANARGAMPQGGQLLIKTRNFVAKPDMFSLARDQGQYLQKFKNTRRNYIELTMADTGVGMAQETRARIFEPFFTTKEVGEGTGLGLAVVYGIVKQHEGFIHVESELEKGTTFKIYLPTISHAETIEQKKKKVESVPGGNETILIGEDDRAVRNVTVRILSGLGYKVLTAKDGWEAVQVFKDKVDKVDLVLLDVVMPKSSGPETYKKLLTIKPDLPVIFTTGYNVHVETSELDLFKKASIPVLHKPYTKSTLGRKVREVLSSSNNR